MIKLPAFLRGIILYIAGVPILCLGAFSQTPPHDREQDLTNLSLEELGQVEVYSASKFNQKATEAPASISIVTASDIQRYGYRTFDEILRNITGFYVTYDRNYAYLGIRGFGPTGDYNSRILLLLNGHRLNENIFSAAGVGTEFPIDLSLIERIEVVRGPGSSLYGTNAFFAVINVITKHGRDFDGAHLSLEAASRQAYQGTATAGQRLKNGFEYVVSGSYMDSKGYRRLYFPEFDTPENNNGIAQDLDTDRSGSLFANISYRDFSTQLVFKSRDKRIPTASYGTVFNDRRLQTLEDWTHLNIKYERTISNNWDVLARTFLDVYESDGKYPYEYFTDQERYIVINRDMASGRRWGGEAQLTRRFAGRHHLTVGTEWNYSFRGNQYNYDEGDNLVYMDSRKTGNELGTYIQGELVANDNLLLSAGVRYDHYSTFGGTTNPRFGLVYSPWKNTNAKLLYGHAFRAPNFFELYYDDSYSMKGNATLRPEKIKTLELVLERQFGSRFRLAGSAYKYLVEDRIVQRTDESDGLAVFVNQENVRAQGIELELEGKDLYGLDGRISYALQRAVARPGDTPLANSPQHIAQLNLFKPLFGMRGGAGLHVLYMSSRRTLADNYTGGYFLTNLTATYKNLLPNLDLSAGIYNLFNKQYFTPGGAEHVSDALQQDGRSYRIRLGYSFPMQ